MARCPECGGSLGPFLLFRVRSRRPTRCRWCRAAIAVSRPFSLLRDLAVVLAGSSGTTWFLLRWLDRGAATDLLAAGLVPVLAVGAGWLAEIAAPLVTLEPRDLPHWARRPEGDGETGAPGNREDRARHQARSATG